MMPQEGYIDPHMSRSRDDREIDTAEAPAAVKRRESLTGSMHKTVVTGGGDFPSGEREEEVF